METHLSWIALAGLPSPCPPERSDAAGERPLEQSSGKSPALRGMICYDTSAREREGLLDQDHFSWNFILYILM